MNSTAELAGNVVLGPQYAKDANQLEGESAQARLERLGRQRPERLTSLWMEIGFCFSIVMSQLLSEYFVSGFTVLIPTVAEQLNIPPASTTWPASAFSLVLSSFLLPFGRLADIYGGFPVYIAGCAWTCIWSIIAGFAQNELMMDFCRALQGLGPAAFLPASLTLLGSMYRPGPRKNMVFSIYGAMAPFGFFVGIFFAGLAAEYTTWQWYFFIGAILTLITGIVAFFTVPSDHQERKGNGVQMDWWGTATTSAGFILIVFAITDASHAPNGWATPYIPVTLILGVLSLCAAFYVEGWVAEQPLLPFDIFRIKYMKPFIVGLLFAYACLGLFLLYVTLYCQNILGVSPFLLVAWYIPMGLGGCILATVGGLFLHRIPGTILAYITGVAIIINAVLFATAPDNANYWAWYFPAFICATVAVDLIFNVANIFFTSAMPTRQQGLAGGLSNVLVQLAIAIGLGFGDVVATETAWQGERQSYMNVFWFEMACGAAALLIFIGFVRIDSAKSDYTADEKEEQAKQEQEQEREDGERARQQEELEMGQDKAKQKEEEGRRVST